MQPSSCDASCHIFTSSVRKKISHSDKCDLTTISNPIANGGIHRNKGKYIRARYLANCALCSDLNFAEFASFKMRWFSDANLMSFPSYRVLPALHNMLLSSLLTENLQDISESFNRS